MTQVFLLVGVPGSGKSWIAEQVSDLFEYVSNDAHIGGDYLGAVLDAVNSGQGPVLAECPYSISKLKDPLEADGNEVIPVFVFADESDLEARWDERGGVALSTRKGHLSRQETYAERAEEYGAFSGTSAECLVYLRDQCQTQAKSRRQSG